jgi:hypothetical protein
MSRSESHRPARQGELQTAVHGQSWSWLTEIGRRLDFIADIVDEHGTPLGLTPTGSTTATVRRLLAGAGELGGSSVVQPGHKQRLTIDGWDTVSCPFALGRTTVGALVLLRQTDRTVPAGGDLDEIATWLVRAVQAQLDLPVEETEAFDRVSSLHKLLHDAVERGVEQEVITAFAEALIAWDGVEVRGYLQDGHGQFNIAVATPGADRSQPGAIALAAAVPRDATLARLTGAEAARLGFQRDRDHFLARVGGAYAQPWLMALSGSIRSDDESRLSLYVDLLREAVDRVATIAETRLSWAMLQQLLGGPTDVDDAGEGALLELKRAVGAEHAALEVTASRGMRVMSIGDAAAFTAAAAPDQADQIVSTVPVYEGHTMVLAIRRPRTSPFTRRERQVADRAAAIFSAWLAGVLKRSTASLERRAENREFQQVLDRVASQTIRDGVDAAVVVLLAPGVVSRPGLLQRWTAEIRGRLRGSDLAGALSDREIGILLSGINPSDVATVSARICQQALRERGGLETGVAIGMAARPAGAVLNGSLVKEARQDAERQRPAESAR